MQQTPSPTPLRIAVGGSDGGRVDQHFGQADAFLVYESTADGPVLLERRDIEGLALAGEERRETIVRILKDCRMLLVVKIGDTPRALLAAAGIEGTDRYADKPVRDALADAFARHAA